MHEASIVCLSEAWGDFLQEAVDLLSSFRVEVFVEVGDWLIDGPLLCFLVTPEEHNSPDSSILPNLQNDSFDNNDNFDDSFNDNDSGDNACNIHVENLAKPAI